MHFLLPLLGMIAIIIVSTAFGKRYPRIPTALFQIAFGIVFSLLPLRNVLEFEPEVFMVCLIAPLLFVDGSVVSRRELWTFKRPVLLMAFGLVLITVPGIGWVIHMLIPAMPLPVAFALAAVLSPTDAVAVKSITKGLPLPRGLMPVLEGESLLNDAAGIVSFKVALSVFLTGIFSWKGATLNFIVVSAGGLLAGFVLGYLFVAARLMLRRRGFEEVNTLVAMQLITPFLIYIAAEELHVSGILAVVAAGITHGIERDRLQQTTTRMQMFSSHTWSVLGYLLNGFVFVLLGYLLPDVWRGMLESGEVAPGKAIGLTALIVLAMMGIRYLWVFRLYRLFVRERRQWGRRKEPDEAAADSVPAKKLPSRARYALIAAVCGIHGTITLATALSFPLVDDHGAPFPLRSTILFIAAGVILISLILAVVALPLMLGGVEAERAQEDEMPMSLRDANIYKLRRTIGMLASESGPENKAATAKVVENLDYQLRTAEEGGQFRFSGEAIREYRRIGREAEAGRYEQMVREERLSPQMKVIFPMYHEPLGEATFLASFKRMMFHYKLNKAKRSIERRRFGARGRMTDRFSKVEDLIDELHAVESELQQAAVKEIERRAAPETRQEAMLVIQHYTRGNRHAAGGGHSEEEFQLQLQTVQLRSIQIGRDTVQELEEAGQISPATAAELRQTINYDELLLLDNSREA